MSIDNEVVLSSLKYCKNLAKSHYENFPVGSLLVPKKNRQHVYSVYAFARTADDIADSGELSEDQKLERLNLLEELISEKKTLATEFGFEKFLPALFFTIDELKIPNKELLDLLSAFKQDAVKQKYQKFEELIDYSSRSANPIGHLVLIIFGYNEKENADLFQYSDKICTALQLTNFWQDVSVDLKIDRVYIPEEDMLRYGYSYAELINNVENENFIRVIRSLLKRTNELFDKGSPIVWKVKGRLGFELKATINGGREILNKIKHVRFKVLSKRVTLTKSDKLKILFKTLFTRV